MLLGVIKDYGLEASAAADIRQARPHLQKPDLSLVLCESNLPDGSFRDLFDASPLRTDAAGGVRSHPDSMPPFRCPMDDDSRVAQAREPGAVELRADRGLREDQFWPLPPAAAAEGILLWLADFRKFKVWVYRRHRRPVV